MGADLIVLVRTSTERYYFPRVRPYFYFVCMYRGQSILKNVLKLRAYSGDNQHTIRSYTRHTIIFNYFLIGLWSRSLITWDIVYRYISIFQTNQFHWKTDSATFMSFMVEVGLLKDVFFTVWLHQSQWRSSFNIFNLCKCDGHVI